jgi:phage gpG-like protein
MTFRLDDADITAKLQDLQNRLQDMAPLMSLMGEILVASINDNFESESGGFAQGSNSILGNRSPWPELSPATVNLRIEKGYWPGQILKQTGRLVSSIHWEATPNSVAVGTNVEYAADLHFGDPTKRMPPRPFLLVQQDDVEKIRKAIADYLTIGD